MRARVCALVEAGDVPGRNPLLPALAERLAGRDIGLTTFDPTGAYALPVRAPRADLYLLKGDDPAVLTAAGCLHDTGARLLNTAGATGLVADKARALARVAAAGVRVPATTVVGARDALAHELGSGPRVVKPVRGAHGDGVSVLGPGQAGVASGGGPWLVQEVVPGDGWDLKVYGVGTRTAVRRVRFSPGIVDQPRLPVPDPPAGVVDAAIAAAGSCDLVCWGADFLIGPEGPVLIDLNAFPGYRGVPAGADWVADAVVAALADG